MTQFCYEYESGLASHWKIGISPLPWGEIYLSAKEKVGRCGEKLPDMFILSYSTITKWNPEYIRTFVLGYN